MNIKTKTILTANIAALMGVSAYSDNYYWVNNANNINNNWDTGNSWQTGTVDGVLSGVDTNAPLVSTDDIYFQSSKFIIVANTSSLYA